MWSGTARATTSGSTPSPRNVETLSTGDGPEVLSPFRQNATVTGFVVLSGGRSLDRGRACRGLERVQLHPDLVLLARCRGRLVEREPFRSRRSRASSPQ